MIICIKPYINSYYYSPPEILLNQWFWEEKSRDVWSIGWVLYEMLTGSKLQYDPNDSASISIPLEISEDWSDFLWKCLEFNPKK